LSFNARSIVNKIDMFKAIVCNLQPDIIGITESWTSDKIFDSELQLDNYCIFRCDRASGIRGGGVLLYVKESLHPVEIRTKTIYDEHVWCSIGDLLIGVCYRSTNPAIAGQNNDENLRKLLLEVSSKHVLIMGDFNYPGIDWTSCSVTANCNAGTNEFVQAVEDCFYTQHVLYPTRNEAILDLIFTSDPDLVNDVQIMENLGTSDHNMITFTVQFKHDDVRNERIIRDYHKGDYDGIRNELKNVDWDGMLANDMEDSWSKFKYLLLEFKHIPVKKVQNCGRVKKPMWMSHRALKLVKKKNRVFNKFKDKDHPAVKKANKVVGLATELRKAKYKFEKKLAENIKLDKKSFYAYSRTKSKTKAQIGTLLTSDGLHLDDDKSVVECFNQYFASVFTRDNLQAVSPVQISVNKMEPIHVDDILDVNIITKVIEKLTPDKAHGPDELSAKMLLETRKEIAYPLLLLFKKSLNEASVPLDWRSANVTPIFKKGTRSSVENYRPVSLTSLICKVFESIIRDIIVEYLESNQLITTSQHGFRKGRSCLTNLLEFLDKVTGYVDSGENVDVVFLDFAKAFDKVSYRRLVLKLEAHGIDSKLISWIAAWLHKRVQRVCLRGVNSGWLEVLSGVPQGSVLGPLLFLIFINDLDNGIKNWILKFADDTKLFGKIKDSMDVQKFQDDIDKLLKWSEEWQMLFNTSKCKVMQVGRPSFQRQYYMKDEQLEVVCYEKDLGVLISNDLKVSQQCQQAYNKASKILGLVNRTIEYRDTDILLRLYKSLVRPHLEYCVPAWAPHYIKDKALIESIQRRFTRMIPSIRKFSYEERLKKLGLWSLEDRRIRADLIEVYKMVYGLSSVRLNTFFELSSSDRTRGHSLKFKKNRFRTELRQHFFSERVVNIWNKLDDDTVCASSLNSFKQHIQKIYQDGSFHRLLQSI